MLLVVEVSESSVEYDRELKLPLYGRSGVAEAWLVDLEADAVEVHRSPSAEGYREILRPGRDGTLRPVELADVEIDVDEVLPEGSG